MEKTKLGISDALAAFIIVCIAYFSGYLGLILCAGYVLLREDSKWLKKFTLLVLLCLILFSLLNLATGVIPAVLDIFDNLLGIFKVTLLDKVVSFIARAENFLDSILVVARMLVFAVLGFSALGRKEIAVPFLDRILEKHFS